MNTAPINDIIMYRILCFFVSGLSNDDAMISNLFRNTLISNTSYMIANINTILQRFGISYVNILSLNKGMLRQIFQDMIGEKDWQCNIIEELMSMREDNNTAPLNSYEIGVMLDQVCTDFLGS